MALGTTRTKDVSEIRWVSIPFLAYPTTQLQGSLGRWVEWNGVSWKV